MKVDPLRPLAAASPSRRSASGDTGFALPSEAATPAAPILAATPLSGMDALLALQTDYSGRRRRQVRRAAETLDALDALSEALLAGGDGDLTSLQALAHGREPTEDAGLDAVLNDIDVRLAVEIAKRERRSVQPSDELLGAPIAPMS